jgi:hypothetical protein
MAPGCYWGTTILRSTFVNFSDDQDGSWIIHQIRPFPSNNDIGSIPVMDIQREIRDDTSVVRRALLPSRYGLEEWDLVEHDGKTISVAPETWSIPDSGAIRIWSETGLGFRRWQVLSRPADSLGWIRATIRESRISDGYETEVRLRDLRWNRATGQRLPIPGYGCPEPDEAWRSAWTDSVTTEGTAMRHYTQVQSDTSGPWGATSIETPVREWIRNGESDVLHCGKFQRELYLRDGVIIRLGSIVAVAAHSAKPEENFESLCRKHPSTPVRWTTIDGRTGIVPALRLVEQGVTNRTPTFVQARFPDGSRFEKATPRSPTR